MSVDELKAALTLIGALRFEEARRTGEGLVTRFPEQQFGHRVLGQVAVGMHEWAEAAQHFQRAVALCPEEKALWEPYARVLIKLGDLSEARTVLYAGLERFPGFRPLEHLLRKVDAVSKTDVLQSVIDAFGFETFIEYNKYISELVSPTLRVKEWVARFIWEGDDREGNEPDLAKQARLLAGSRYPREAIVTPDKLAESVEGRTFDVAFLDPLHFRPEVDRSIKVLCGVLRPGGMLLVHDCNPEDESITGVTRTKGAWVGETYKAFVNFHRHNRERSLTVDVDYGVGVIVNRGLELDFDDAFDISYAEFSRDRVASCGLTGWDDFRRMLESRSGIFAE